MVVQKASPAIYKKDFDETVQNYGRFLRFLPTEMEAKVLAQFAFLGKATPPAIAEALKIDGAEATRLCKSLNKKGHLVLTERRHREFAILNPNKGGLGGVEKLLEGLQIFHRDLERYFDASEKAPRVSIHDQYGPIEATEPITRDYFRRAEHEICISTSTGVWLWNFLEDLSGAVDRGVKLRVLLMDPKRVSEKFQTSTKIELDSVKNRIDLLTKRLGSISPDCIRYCSEQQIGSIVDGKVAILPIFHVLAQSAVRGTSVISAETNLAFHCQTAFNDYWKNGRTPGK